MNLEAGDTICLFHVDDDAVTVTQDLTVISAKPSEPLPADYVATMQVMDIIADALRGIVAND